MRPIILTLTVMAPTRAKAQIAAKRALAYVDVRAPLGQLHVGTEIEMDALYTFSVVDSLDVEA